MRRSREHITVDKILMDLLQISLHKLDSEDESYDRYLLSHWYWDSLLATKRNPPHNSGISPKLAKLISGKEAEGRQGCP